MNQMTFSDMKYSGRKRVTQKEKFLREMNDIIPWADWVNKILPYYPKGKRGRPPRGIEVMLRMYLLQIWFNLSDEGLEDAICDSYAMRNFVGINFLEEQVPDATTAFGWWPFFVSICIVCFLIISRILHINPLKEGEGDIIFHCGKEKIKIHVIVTQEAFAKGSDDDFFGLD